MKLKDKVALFVNGGSPLDRAIALTLSEEGAHVSLCGFPDRSSSLKILVREIVEGGGRSQFQEGDLTDPAQVQEMVEKTRKDFQKIDILVNAATASKPWPRFIEGLTGDDWDEAMAVGLRSAFLFCRAVSKIMLGQKNGRIINFSSQGGRTVDELSSLADVTTKSGILGLTLQIAHQLGPHGITVNAVAPGIVLPGWRWEQEWKALREEKREAILKQIPLRRFARPEEVARAVVFLASEDASYITGTTLDVNGGQRMPIFSPSSETLAGGVG
jgi:3-oxoacyl-[acyl-carrier protein] reductase